MGKRKRKADQNKTPTPPPPAPPAPSEMMPCSSRMASLTKEKSSRSVDSSTVKSLASIMDIMDGHEKQPTTQQSHQNLNRAIFLRHPRYYLGRQYVRRNSTKNAGASTSHGKGTPSPSVEKLSSKSASQYNSDAGLNTESKETAVCRPERVRSSSLAVHATSPSAMRTVCGICERLLKRKPYILDNTISASDVSVVAVLVCGHVYHADCLEQRTCNENRQDPPCPLCAGLLQQADVASGLD